VPVVALGLTVTWGSMPISRKSLPIGPNQGFMLEVLILPPCAGLSGLAGMGTGQGAFLRAGAGRRPAAAAGCGMVTAVPLMIYANGAKLLRLSTIGMMQYIAPTMIFLTAVFVFDEPFGRHGWWPFR
jgi:chloramphenicol-sensitive protein RarD